MKFEIVDENGQTAATIQGSVLPQIGDELTVAYLGGSAVFKVIGRKVTAVDLVSTQWHGGVPEDFHWQIVVEKVSAMSTGVPGYC
jgi:uncharacterized protein YxjI